MHRRLFSRRTIVTGLIAVGCAVGPAVGSLAGSAAAASTASPSRDVIVLLKDFVSTADPVASEHARSRGARVKHVYNAALRGYAADVPDNQLAALRQDSRVEAVIEDKVFSFASSPHASRFPQLISFAVDRVEADISSTKAGNQRGQVDADVAIMDDGLGPHDDLNVVGGINCGNELPVRDFTATDDNDRHGTAVAGVFGAKDNKWDYVGTAPGVRIWSVKVIDNEGSIPDSNLLCGLDWIAGHSGVLEVVNISLAGDGTDDGNCGRTNLDPIHRAICRVVRRGVTVVVAAGNEFQDASQQIPAAYDEVITVSAMTDLDGLPGGLRDWTSTSPGCQGSLDGAAEEDDTYAFFSNYGADVDLIAPGVCVATIGILNPSGERDLNGNDLASGTSLSTPAVAGAAALYKSLHPRASPAQVRAALIAAGSFDYDSDEDPDGIKEPLLNMATL